MSSEDHERIVELINELHAPNKVQRLQVINSIISGVVLALLIYTSNVIVNLFEKVQLQEKELQNIKRDLDDHQDMDLYRSMLIDHNFKIVNATGQPLNIIYQPGFTLRSGDKQ
jgi:hypothetical protein